MAGGGGVEYYFGYIPKSYGDLGCQDYRSRDKMWDYTRYALQFFRSLPFWQMENYDNLVNNSSHNNDRYCFAKPGERYIVYLPMGGTTNLDLSAFSTLTFDILWYNPRSGDGLAEGSIKSISGGGGSIGEPPSDNNQDWVALITKQGLSNLYVNAGLDQSIDLPQNSVTLTALAFGVQGVPDFLWTQISGGTATLSGENTETLTVSGLQAGTYVFQVTLQDGENTVSDQVEVKVNNANNSNTSPVVEFRLIDTNTNQPVRNSIAPGDQINLDNLPTTDLSIQAIVSRPVQRIRFTLEKPDGSSPYTHTEEVAPYALFKDADGNFQKWEPSPPPLGTYTLTATPYLSAGGSPEDSLTISFSFVEGGESAPIAMAGSSQEITLPITSVMLIGSGTGDIEAYEWKQVSGPVTASLSGVDNDTLLVSGLTVVGQYMFQLTVTNTDGLKGSDNVIVTVHEEGEAVIQYFSLINAATDQPFAGFDPIPDQAVIYLPELGTNKVTIRAHTSPDSVGSVNMVLSGPLERTHIENTGPYSLFTDNNGNYLPWSPAPPDAGTYTLTATPYDAEDASGQAGVAKTITFTFSNSSSDNQPPTVDVGDDQYIELPADSVILIGLANDTEGVVSYMWSQTIGPVTANLIGATNDTLIVTGLTQAGTYIFRLTVTDNASLTAYDDVIVTVGNTGVPAIQYFTLINTDTNEPVAGFNPIAEDAVINLARFNLEEESFNIRVNTTGNPPQRVVFEYTAPDTSFIRDEKTPPYALFGDVEGIFNDWQPTPPSPGQYTLKVTPHTAPGENPGIPLTLHFSIDSLAGEFPPNVSAGQDRIISLPQDSVHLLGSGYDPDGGVVGYMWTKQSGPVGLTLTNEDQPTLIASGLIAGIYVFRLTVNDNEDQTAFAEVTVTVNELGSTQVTYFSLINATTDLPITDFDLIPDQAVIRLPELGTNKLNIQTHTSPDSIGSVKMVLSGTLNRTQVESVGPYALFKDNNGNYLSWIPTPPDTGAYTLTATPYDAEDAMGQAGAPKTVTFTFTNNLSETIDPVVTVSTDREIVLPKDTVHLVGSGYDPDGGDVEYVWTMENGPAGYTLTNANQPTLIASGLVEGIYLFRLTVEDDEDQTAFDEISVKVYPEDATRVTHFTLVDAVSSTPIATFDPIPDHALIRLPALDTNQVNIQVHTLPENVGSVKMVLSGTLDRTQVESVAPYALFKDTNGIFNPWIPTPPDTGIYMLTATPYDSANASGPAGLTKTISFTFSNNLSDTEEPIVKAGINREIILPQDSVHLLGSGYDPDGGTVSYAWTKQSGPTSLTLTNADQPTLIASSLVEGTYLFRLTVEDDEDQTAFDEVIVTVKALGTIQVTHFSLINAGMNQPIAGFDPIPDQAVIRLPELGTNNLTILTHTSPDSVGSVKMVLSGTLDRTQIENEGPYALFKDEEGDYLPWSPAPPDTGVYTLTATPYDAEDALGQVGIAKTITFTFTNSTSDNHPPTAEAGSDLSITMPTDSVRIVGSGEDIDEDNLTFLWEQLGGPYDATLVGVNSATLLAKDLLPGQYDFRLTVKDAYGATATDEVSVTVEGITVAWFTLIDAATDQVVTGYEKIPDGATLNLTSLGADSIAIIVQTFPATVGSVRFILSGVQSYQKTESTAPYALFRDTDGDYRPWDPYPPAEGTYQLEAIPFNDPSGTGPSGKSLKISFTITNSVGN